jgi:hypothetical protein
MAAHLSWSLADLLDLEFLLDKDRQEIMAGGEEKLHRRDREIYQKIEALCPDSDAKRLSSCLLRHWLEQRRKAASALDSEPLPGQIFFELIRISCWLFFGAALVSGWGLVFSFLTYGGKAPINVATFLALFVGTQLLLLFILLFFLAAGRLKTRPQLPLTYSLIQRGLLALLKKLGRRFFSSKSYPWLEQLSGNFHAYGDLYGLLFMLPVFLLIQLAAVGFNLGILAGLLFKVMTTDLAFGWQTTLTTGPEAVARLVELLALPWSWLFPAGTGYPDPAQVEGSRIILKEGIRHLNSTALSSWWPFLFLCVTVYGLVPRLLLYAGGRVAAHHLLRVFQFDSAAHHQLLQRMQTPILTTSEKEKPRQPAVDSVEEKKAPESKTRPTAGRALLLVPEELREEYPVDILRARIGRQAGYREMEVFFFDPYDDQPALAGASFSTVVADRQEPVLLLQEAWQPPINEFLHFLGHLRKQLGNKVLITVFLIGKPEPNSPLTPPRSQDRAVWMDKISALGDPRLGVLSFRNPHPGGPGQQRDESRHPQ